MIVKFIRSLTRLLQNTNTTITTVTTSVDACQGLNVLGQGQSHHNSSANVFR